MPADTTMATRRCFMARVLDWKTEPPRGSRYTLPYCIRLTRPLTNAAAHHAPAVPAGGKSAQPFAPGALFSNQVAKVSEIFHCLPMYLPGKALTKAMKRPMSVAWTPSMIARMGSLA